MEECMHTNQLKLERELERAVSQEMQHRRVWLWGVPAARRQAPVTPRPATSSGESMLQHLEGFSDKHADSKHAPIQRGRAVLRLLRLSIE